MSLRSLRVQVWGVLAASFIVVPAARAQVASPLPDTITRRPERITGLVTTDSGVPIAGAVISVTRAPDRAFQRDSTGPDGRYSITWDEGTGDYLVHIAAVGHESFRRRVRRESPGDTVFRVDAALKATAAQLAAVQVTAERPTPRRGTDYIDTPTGGGQVNTEGLYGALSPDLAGDLASLAATAPGMLSTGTGFSALGLGAAQNAVTLGGMSFGGGELPREARIQSAVATSPYDAARGGFSGAELSLDFGFGSLFTRRTGSVSLDAPQLQVVDATARRLGQRFTNVKASVGGGGPLRQDDRNFYSIAVDYSRRTSDAVSLLDAHGDALRAAGVASDSAAALAQALRELGVPLTVAGAGARTTDQGIVIAQYGWSDYDWVQRKDRNRSGSVIGYARLRRAQAVNVAPTAVVTQAGESVSGTGALLGRYSHYFGEHADRLLELRSGLTVDRDETTPALDLPGGQVLVGAPAEGEDPTDAAFTSLRFGGGAALQSARRAWTWDTRAQAEWFANARHRLKLTAQSRLDGFDVSPSGNRLGTFAFNSLDDLRAGRPASFSRVLVVPERSGGVWNGAFSAGDFWKVHDRVNLVYGARVEANRYTAAPAHNPRIAELFGASTSFVPNRVHVSPRAGFTIRYNRGKGEGAGVMFNDLGQFPLRPRGYLRGGFGEFRALPAATLLSDPLAATGLPDGTLRLTCIGDAVPTPAWNAYVAGTGTIPTTCADGTSSFIDAAPTVTLIDPAFDVPRSWRGNLSATALWWKVSVVVDGTVSFNHHQPGTADLNIREAPVASLASEGGRAMYAPLTSIVPATGVISAVDARRTEEFGRVTSLRSDLRSTSRQLSVLLRPDLGGWSILNVSYTLASVREEQRGFDGAAFGDLWARERARGAFDSRHQLIVSVGRMFRGGASVSLHGVFRSGLPYTPYVVGDVNGDGASNDRAFVHAPAKALAAGDAQFAADMQSLLTHAPAHARECLAAQLDRPAGRNSCEGPWSATMNARLNLPWEFIPMAIPERKRVSMSLHLTNPLGAIDQLLHGSGGLRGWGGPAHPDAALYTVTGFDPDRERFRYRVNPRFGSTSPLRSTLRTPFRVTLFVSADLGRSLEEQQVSKFLEPGRTRKGVRLDSAALRNRYSRATPNVYLQTLRLADSLLLSAEQVAALEVAQTAYLVRVDSLWGALAREFADLPVDFNSGHALRRQEEVVDAGWEINKEAARHIRTILSPLQFSLAPWMVISLANTEGRVRMRYF